MDMGKRFLLDLMRVIKHIWRFRKEVIKISPSFMMKMTHCSDNVVADIQRLHSKTFSAYFAYKIVLYKESEKKYSQVYICPLSHKSRFNYYFQDYGDCLYYVFLKEEDIWSEKARRIMDLQVTGSPLTLSHVEELLYDMVKCCL